MSSDMSVKVRGDKEFKAKLGKFRKEVEPKKAVTKATTYLLEHIKTRQIKHRSGSPIANYLTARHGGAGITGAIRAKVAKEAGQIVGRVGAGGLQGRILRAHEDGITIRPRRASHLVFRTHDGSWHSVKSVTLPKRETFGRGMKEARPKVVKILNGCIQDAKRKARI